MFERRRQLLAETAARPLQHGRRAEDEDRRRFGNRRSYRSRRQSLGLVF